LHELSGWPALRPLRVLPLGPQVNDPEGVTWLGGSLLAVVNEDGGQVVEVDTAKADGLYMIILQVQGQSSLAPGDRYTGWLDALRRIPQREGGWKALYRGNGANIVRLVPEVAFKFVVHDQLKIILGSTDSNPSGMVDRMAAGAATGVLKSLLFYPLDLARTRITADLAAAGQARNYANIRHCLSRTFAQGSFCAMKWSLCELHYLAHH
ncbi:uncharacterized protein HaLaN_23423, partial [Haematococcus lacustris]